MKAYCLKKYFKDAVLMCEKISGKNLTLPVLSNIIISGDGNGLKFTATNLEVGLEVSVPAKVEEKGKVAVPAGIISGFLSNFSFDDNISIESKNNNLSLVTSNTSTLIKGQPFDDFPNLPKIKNETEIEMPARDFVSGLKSVMYAASLLNIKPEISSVYINSGSENTVVFAATDSFRLAEKKINQPFNGFKNILIPLKSVSEILRIFDGKEGNIKLIPDKNQIMLLMDNIKFISRLTEGIFPDYRQIIPNKFTTDVIVNKDLFLNSLKIASVFSGKLNEINIITGSDGKSLTISTVNSESGEHVTNIPAKITGEELKMSFNHKYIFDCLQQIPSSEIILRFSGDGKPLVITGINDNSFQYLVMPMNNL